MLSAYNLDKIKYATDPPTFQRAIGLYESGKVTKFAEEPGSFSALVLGSKPYMVSISARHYDEGYCACYLGQNDTRCKHMVAVAIFAAMDGKPLSEKDKQLVSQPICSRRLGTLNKTELNDFKKSVSGIIQKHIKPYEGPSRIWFRYQNKLDEGCNRLAALISELPVSKQTAILLIDTLLRLDKKLSTGGVDDSNGTVGDFIIASVDVLREYARLTPPAAQAFSVLKNRQTCFGWEEPLLEILTAKTG